MIDRKSLKIYDTLKKESKNGVFRRPGSEYLVNDGLYSDAQKPSEIKKN